MIIAFFKNICYELGFVDLDFPVIVVAPCGEALYQSCAVLCENGLPVQATRVWLEVRPCDHSGQHSYWTAGGSIQTKGVNLFVKVVLPERGDWLCFSSNLYLLSTWMYWY